MCSISHAKNPEPKTETGWVLNSPCAIARGAVLAWGVLPGNAGSYYLLGHQDRHHWRVTSWGPRQLELTKTMRKWRWKGPFLFSLWENSEKKKNNKFLLKSPVFQHVSPFLSLVSFWRWAWKNLLVNKLPQQLNTHTRKWTKRTRILHPKIIQVGRWVARFFVSPLPFFKNKHRIFAPETPISQLPFFFSPRFLKYAKVVSLLFACFLFVRKRASRTWLRKDAKLYATDAPCRYMHR